MKSFVICGEVHRQFEIGEDRVGLVRETESRDTCSGSSAFSRADDPSPWPKGQPVFQRKILRYPHQIRAIFQGIFWEFSRKLLGKPAAKGQCRKASPCSDKRRTSLGLNLAELAISKPTHSMVAMYPTLKSTHYEPNLVPINSLPEAVKW